MYARLPGLKKLSGLPDQASHDPGTPGGGSNDDPACRLAKNFASGSARPVKPILVKNSCHST